MKYIMLEDETGKKYPIIFPESLVHLFVSQAIEAGIARKQKLYLMTVSAGFVGLGDIQVNGESESLSLKSKPSDAAYIALGEAVSRMPEEMVIALLEKANAG